MKRHTKLCALAGALALIGRAARPLATAAPARRDRPRRARARCAARRSTRVRRRRRSLPTTPGAPGARRSAAPCSSIRASRPRGSSPARPVTTPASRGATASRAASATQSKTLRRRSPTLLNLAWAEALFWDGRAFTLEEQALGPIASPDEMNMPLEQLIPKIQAVPGYAALFERAYPGEGIATTPSPRRSPPSSAPWSPRARPSIAGSRATRARSRRKPLAASSCSTTRRSARAAIPAGASPTTAFTTSALRVKTAAAPPSSRESKPWSTRSRPRRCATSIVAAPYLHDGSEPTLESVVELYDLGGRVKRPSLSKDIVPLEPHGRGVPRARRVHAHAHQRRRAGRGAEAAAMRGASRLRAAARVASRRRPRPRITSISQKGKQLPAGDAARAGRRSRAVPERRRDHAQRLLAHGGRRLQRRLQEPGSSSPVTFEKAGPGRGALRDPPGHEDDRSRWRSEPTRRRARAARGRARTRGGRLRRVRARLRAADPERDCASSYRHRLGGGVAPAARGRPRLRRALLALPRRHAATATGCSRSCCRSGRATTTQTRFGGDRLAGDRGDGARRPQRRDAALRGSAQRGGDPLRLVPGRVLGRAPRALDSALVHGKRIAVVGFAPFGGARGESLGARWCERSRASPGSSTAVLPGRLPARRGRSCVACARRRRARTRCCCSAAATATSIRLERVALNLDDARVARTKTASGVAARRSVPAGPVGHWSTLPLEAFAAALASRALPFVWSRDAGGFLCNHVFYVARDWVEPSGPSMPCGFVHLPPLEAPRARAPARGRAGLPGRALALGQVGSRTARRARRRPAAARDTRCGSRRTRRARSGRSRC